MSTTEYQQDIKSKVKISTNAKQEPQVEVSVREGTTGEELERIRQLAVAAYRTTCAAVKS